MIVVSNAMTPYHVHENTLFRLVWSCQITVTSKKTISGRVQARPFTIWGFGFWLLGIRPSIHDLGLRVLGLGLGSA